MKVKVDENKCIGCGSCVSLTDSKIFDFNDDGLAQTIVDKVEKKDEEIVENAINYCPTAAIEEVDTEEVND